MEKLRRNTSAKILIILLLTIFIPFTVFGFISVFRLSSYNAYHAENFADTDFIDMLIDIDEAKLQDSSFYNNRNDAKTNFKLTFAEDYNGEPLCNCVITVTYPNGGVLLQNYTAPCNNIAVKHYTLTYGFHPVTSYWLSDISEGSDNPLSKVRYDTSSQCPVTHSQFAEWLLTEKGINTAGMTGTEIYSRYAQLYFDFCDDMSTVSVYTNPEGYYNITIARTEESIEFLSQEYFITRGYQYRYPILVITVISFILSLILSVLLFLSALRPVGEPRRAGKIPFELFLLLSAGAALLLYQFFDCSQNISDDKKLNLLAFISSVYLIALFCVSLLYSVFIRLRYRNWWKNTLIYSIYSIIDWFMHNLSDVASVLICCLAWVIINVVFAMIAIKNTAVGISLLIIFNLAVIAFVVIIAAQWQKLKKIASNIAEGNSGLLADTDRMLPSIKAFGNDLNKISLGMETAIEDQLRSERMKTDLITNVSHDLKTPLTSIVSYIGLLKAQDVENETARGYIDTLDRQSVRLGRLIEDLVEASKVTSGNVKVDLTQVNIRELLEQAVSEYEMRLEQCRITPVLSVQGGSMTAIADGRLLWRVFDNLLSNACKYAMTDSRLYIDSFSDGNDITVVFKNISASALNIPPEELMERFVRGDSSRSTSGSGLGLTIAKTLTELQNGSFSLEIDGDLFKAIVVLPAEKQAIVSTDTAIDII